jgi:hypothetical protein
MSYQDDYANGRRSPSSWSNQPGADAYNRGSC